MKVKLLKINFILSLIIILIIGYFNFSFFKSKKHQVSSVQQNIVLNDDDFTAPFVTNSKTVSDFLQEQSLNISKFDLVFPAPQTKLTNGTHIVIKRAKKINIFADDKKTSIYTFKNSVHSAMLDAGIILNTDDILSVDPNSFAYNDMDIKITRVIKKNKVIKKDIPFTTKTKQNNKLSWQKEAVKQKGSPGIEEITYEIIYHDGKELKRREVKSEITKKPIPHIIEQGTYVKLGKKHTGQASWYAFTGTMSAANPWLPIGSYVKVTNLANNKSVIVRINDRGPFVDGRIIDLDKVAFEKIASIGAGVINVKMEEIKN